MVAVVEAAVVVAVAVVWRHCSGDRCLATSEAVTEAGDRAAAGVVEASAAVGLVAAAVALVEVSAEVVTSEVEVLEEVGKKDANFTDECGFFLSVLNP